MRSRLRLILGTLALCGLFLCGCGKTERHEMTIWHASDLHYLSPALISDRAAFASSMEQGDGKVTHYTPEICRSFVDAAIAAKPDAIVISGDLTLNGSLQSHTELTALLKEIREAGIRVFVIPGNHDMGKVAYRFLTDTLEPVPAAAPEDFARLYADFGYSDALSRDKDTLSYVADAGGGVRLLMLDVNSGSYGTVPDSTLTWAKKQLRQARQAGCAVITVSHQNLERHSPMFVLGYEINNRDALEAIYADAGVKLNLSGHLHIQHITTDTAVTDIAVSSLAVTPNQFGVLSVHPDGSMDYETCPLDVTAFDEEGNLLNFRQFSADFFDSCTIFKNSQRIASLDVDEDSAQLMLETSVAMNREYFGGRVGTDHSEGLALWTENAGTFSSNYLDTIAAEAGRDHTRWSTP